MTEKRGKKIQLFYCEKVEKESITEIKGEFTNKCLSQKKKTIEDKNVLIFIYQFCSVSAILCFHAVHVDYVIL